MNKEKFWFWILLDILILALVVNVLFFVMPMISRLGSSFEPARTITVSAEGKTTATPDLADISFSVVSQGANPNDLSTNNNTKMSAAIQFLTSQGIASSDIATTDYNLSPDYSYDTNTQRQYVTGYTLTQTVTVKVRDITKVASVIGGLTPLGVNQIGDIDFTFADPESVVALARTDAISQIKAKAAAMASELGDSVGSVVNVSEDSLIPGPLPVFSGASGMALTAAVAPSPAVQPGTQDVTDDVTVTYQLQ